MAMYSMVQNRASLARRFVMHPVRYCQIRFDQRSYYYTMSKVTRLESIRALRDKIDALEQQLMDL